MKKYKKNLLLIATIVVACAVYGFYMYKKKPADVRKESAAYELTATSLVAAFNKDENSANKKYIDKVLAVKGKIAGIKADSTGQATVFLDSGDPMASVTCSFYPDEIAAAKTLHQGDEVTIKGRCTGKLMDVVLNKCSINK